MRTWLARKESKLSDILWNAAGSLFYSGQMAIMLIFMSRWYDMVVIGIINIGYALAGTYSTFGRFGVRNYHVTDNDQRHTFGDYIHGRYITVGANLLVAIGYLLIQWALDSYDPEKCILIFELIMLKNVDAIEGCYVGQYQRIGRFSAGAKMVMLHQMITTVILCLGAICHLPMQIVLLAAIVVSYVSTVGLVHYMEPEVGMLTDRHWSFKHVFEIIRDCIPLCIGTVLAIYVGNIPRYTIDAYLGEEAQAIFGYVMIPVFVITLLNQFVYQPFVKDLGDLWNQGRIRTFRRTILRQCLFVVALAIVVLIACLVIGLPLLSFIYGVDLMAYKAEFMVLLLGGSLYAIAFYMSIPITVMRKQIFIAVVYVVVVLFSFVIRKPMALRLGMQGVSWLYVLINSLLLLIYVSIVIGVSQAAMKRDKELAS